MTATTPTHDAPRAIGAGPEDAPIVLAGIPIVAAAGALRLREAERMPICHGYANGCECAECEERANPTAPELQPWEPRPMTRCDTAE